MEFRRIETAGPVEAVAVPGAASWIAIGKGGKKGTRPCYVVDVDDIDNVVSRDGLGKANPALPVVSGPQETVLAFKSERTALVCGDEGEVREIELPADIVAAAPVSGSSAVAGFVAVLASGALVHLPMKAQPEGSKLLKAKLEGGVTEAKMITLSNGRFVLVAKRDDGSAAAASWIYTTVTIMGPKKESPMTLEAAPAQALPGADATAVISNVVRAEGAKDFRVMWADGSLTSYTWAEASVEIRSKLAAAAGGKILAHAVSKGYAVAIQKGAKGGLVAVLRDVKCGVKVAEKSLPQEIASAEKVQFFSGKDGCAWLFAEGALFALRLPAPMGAAAAVGAFLPQVSESEVVAAAKKASTLKEVSAALPGSFLATRSGVEQLVAVVVKEGLFALAYELVADPQLAETAAVSLLSAWPKELCWRVVKSRPPVASATLVGTLRKLLATDKAVAVLERLNLVVELAAKVPAAQIAKTLPEAPQLDKVLQWMGAIVDAKHLDLADSEPFVTNVMGKMDMATGASSVALSSMGKMFSIAAGYRTCAPPAKESALEKITLDL